MRRRGMMWTSSISPWLRTVLGKLFQFIHPCPNRHHHHNHRHHNHHNHHHYNHQANLRGLKFWLGVPDVRRAFDTSGCALTLCRADVHICTLCRAECRTRTVMMPHPPESMPSCDRSKQKRGERGLSEVFAAQPSSILWRIRMSTTMQMRSMGGILSKQALIVNQKHFRHLLTTLTCQLPSHLASLRNLTFLKQVNWLLLLVVSISQHDVSKINLKRPLYFVVVGL